MSPTNHYLPDRGNRLPTIYVAPTNSDENIIDTEEVGPHSQPDDDDWSVPRVFADICAELWSDIPRSAPMPARETVQRPPKEKNTTRRPSSRDFIDQAAQSLHDELDEIPANQEVVCALIRGRLGWYLFFNHNYRKLFPIAIIIFVLFVSGKTFQALELFFKLIF
jgi:hypothetical protein